MLRTATLTSAIMLGLAISGPARAQDVTEASSTR